MLRWTAERCRYATTEWCRRTRWVPTRTTPVTAAPAAALRASCQATAFPVELSLIEVALPGLLAGSAPRSACSICAFGGWGAPCRSRYSTWALGTGCGSSAALAATGSQTAEAASPTTDIPRTTRCVFDIVGSLCLRLQAEEVGC